MNRPFAPWRRCIGLACLTGLVCAAARAEIQKWNPETLFNSSEFSHVATSDQEARTIFLSAQLPLRPDGSMVPSGRVKEQTRQVLDNVRNALASAGAMPEDVIRVHIYVTNYQIGQGIIISGEMRKFFNYKMPTSSFIPVAALAQPDAVLAIDAVAETGLPSRERPGMLDRTSQPGEP